ncbi:Holliday junction branch migration protein RuvA [Patescibacteria group bacterium]|nr:Holliday junction branch migration protein RuvA [Patescibacteria group bacterium]
MLSYIKGKIILKTEHFLIIENQGLGYKIFVASNISQSAQSGNETELFLYQHVREDSLQLFGFSDYNELSLFELLISVSGIGPKTALGVFALAGVNDIKSAIINNDSSMLKKVSGIGNKTAERIVLELKNKVAGIVGVGGIKSKEEMSADSEAVEALTALGFSREKVREVLQEIDPQIKDVRLIVRDALKKLK